LTTRQFRALTQAGKTRHFSEMFEEYERLFQLFLQVADGADAAQYSDWYGLEARVQLLHNRLAALSMDVQIALLNNHERRREIRKGRAIA